MEVVALAQTGAEALRLIRSLKPHVATLDIRMPETNGIQVLEAIRHEGLEVLAIIVTGLDEVEYRRKCRELGAGHFFHKSTEFEKVIEVVREQAARLVNAECGMRSAE